MQRRKREKVGVRLCKVERKKVITTFFRFEKEKKTRLFFFFFSVRFLRFQNDSPPKKKVTQKCAASDFSLSLSLSLSLQKTKRKLE